MQHVDARSRPAIFVVGSFVVACSALVESLPEPGQSLAARELVVEAGGKGFNLALGCRRLGLDAGGIFAIGDDLFAPFAEREIARFGLDGCTLLRRPGRTGMGLGFVDRAGENCLAVLPGANALLSGADARAARTEIERANLVLATFESPDEAIRDAFQMARDAGIPTLLNPSPFRLPDPALLAATTIVVANRGETSALARHLGVRQEADIPGEQIAAALFDQGPDLLVVTRGADGATAYRSGSAPVHQPAWPVRAQDTMGAGDAFTAGLASALAEGRDLPAALRRAAVCGALVAARAGIIDALPDRVAVEALVAAAE